MDVELEPEVEEWIDALTATNYATLLVQVDRLERMGATIREPWSKSLGDGLYELRFDIDRVAWRIPYLFAPHPADRPPHSLPQATQQRATRNHPSTTNDAPLHRRA